MPTGSPLTVCTTHLKAKKPFAQVREQQAIQLARFADSIEEPLILGGDFNADPDEIAIAEMKKSLVSAH